MRFALSYLRCGLVALVAFLGSLAHAEPVDFKLASQPADAAVLAFARQSKVEVLFSSNELHKVKSTAVIEKLEPAEALKRLLIGTGFTARNNGNGKFIITPSTKPTGTLRGRFLRPDGLAAAGVKVTIPRAREITFSNAQGDFEFSSIPPGSYQIAATGADYQPVELKAPPVEPDQVTTLPPVTIPLASGPARLAPFVVESRIDRARFSNRDEMDMPPREATGNLDLIRTQNDALAYTIYDREQISRSGVVSLNEFLQRELLDANSATRAPEQDPRADLFSSGSTNLSLRGYTSDETVVLVNGRRLPEVFVGGTGDKVPPPDVNFIPLSLVQQVEVLPASASSLYTGNPVGGVINIVLRPAVDANATEVTATYTNAVGKFDAPQSSLSIIHAETAFKGRLRLRFNASISQTTPPNESELGYQRKAQAPLTNIAPWASFFRATPTVRSSEVKPLFGPGSAAFTSVAPGADGNGGLAAFNGRDGVRNLDFFNSPAEFAVSRESVDFPYGRKQRRSAYFGSIVFDLFPRLELGLDVTYAQTIATRGLDVFPVDLRLSATSPFNPFRQEVFVSLNDTAPMIGSAYSESRVEFSSAVLGAILKLPADWKLSLDTQLGHSVTKTRGIYGADPARWQQLVDQGIYNPLRDTQIFGPPKEFYDQVLIYRGERGKFTTRGNYDTLDIAGRVTNDNLPLPTGRGVFNFGGDYRRNHLDPYTDKKTYSDGSNYDTPLDWSGRSIERYSIFGELQAPVVPEKWLPRYMPKAEIDAAVRYIASDYTPEANVAPTVAFKVDFVHGFALRGSFTTSNRFPSPQLSRVVLPPPTPGVGVDPAKINDPLRGESYPVFSSEIPNFNLVSEGAVTQTVGLIYRKVEKGHRFRASIDFVDTRKTNELLGLDEQAVIRLERIFPERVIREPAAPGSALPGRITSVFTGTINGSERRSLNWNTNVDYTWADVLGGTLETYARLIYFQRYKSRIAPGEPFVDQLRRPDGTAQLLKYRSNFGIAWSRKRDLGFGIDGHYFHSRVIPVVDWPSQGHDRIRPVWQFDPYISTELSRFLPWKDHRVGLRLQLRVNNVLAAPFPKYVLESSGAGVQPYGDWRGRTYSLSLTATF